MAKTVYVTITGISAKDAGKQVVEVGSEITLMKEPTNSFDSDAIKVLTSDKSMSVGYVANSPHTVTDGTISASELQKLMKTDEVKAKIIRTVEIPFKNGHISKGFIAGVVIESAKSGSASTGKEKQFKFKLVGAKTKYPSKSLVLQELRDGNTPIVKLYVKDDKVVGEFDGGLCGYVDEKSNLSNYDELVEAIGDGERVAKITETAGLNFIGEFSVSKAEMEVAESKKSLKTIIDEIVANDIATQDEINERLTYLKECGLTDKQIKGILKTYIKYDDEVAQRIPDRPKSLFKDSDNIVMRAVVYATAKSNLLLEGPKGVGKNVLAETLAWVFKRPLYEVSLNSQHDNHSLLGGKNFETDEKGNQTLGFEPEPIVQASMYGGVLVLDEFNTALPHVMSMFNSLLDERRRIEVPGFKNINAHPNFLAIATQNRDYQGTFENNEATLERFVPIVMEAPPNIESILMDKFKSVDYDTIRICNTLYQMIKKCVEDGELSNNAITIRGYVDTIKATQMDLPLKMALTDNIMNRARDDFERKTIKNMIEDLLG